MSETSLQTEMKQDTAWTARLTVADGLLLAIGVLAAIMRLANLGGLPLSPAEAEAAYTAWAFWQPHLDALPMGSALPTGSAAYFSFTRLLLPLLGDSDAVMRLVPALFSLGLALLPWLGRSRLGTIGALTVSGLLAVSPLQAVTARTAGGDAIALFALLLLLIAYDRYRETAVSRWLYVLAAALGLGLTSTPLFYSGLLTLALAALVQRLIRLPLFAQPWPRPAPALRRNVILGGTAVFVGVSTLLLWQPVGLGTAARLPAAWLAQFGGAEAFTWADPLLAVARYEPILLTLGLAAIVWATWRTRPAAAFAVYWLAAVLLLMLLQRGEMSHAVLLTLPGFLLVGRMVDSVLNGRLSTVTWLMGAGIWLVLMLALVNAARYVRRAPFEPQQLENIWTIVFAMAFAGVTVYFAASWDAAAVTKGSLLAVLGFFLFINWGAGWWLGHHAANDPRTRWVHEGTDDDLRYLTPVIAELSRQVTNSDQDLQIFSSVESPVLRWYLRPYPQTTFGAALPVDRTPELLITPETTEVALASDYMGSDYGLLRSEPAPPETPALTPIQDTLRWWLFHESNATAPETRVILWLRTDLVRTE